MPRGRPKGLPKTGGRLPGVQNRETREIRELVKSTVDWVKLTKSLERRANAKSDLAARILYEYGYGKPKEIGQESGLSGAELIIALRRIASAFVENPGQGVASSSDSQGAE